MASLLCGHYLGHHAMCGNSDSCCEGVCTKTINATFILYVVHNTFTYNID